MNDIDASPTSDPLSPFYNGGAGWAPIGTFTGTFDGQGFTISNLTIIRGSNDNVGLFSFVTSGADISNLHLAGEVRGDEFSGGLIGQNQGSVTNCSFTGTVLGRQTIGGLIGYNVNGTVTNCHAHGTVNGRDFVGGLIGYHPSGTITDSSSTSTVFGSDSGLGTVGGLVGQSGGTISRCFASGNVSHPPFTTGGLVGFCNGTVINSDAKGMVSGAPYLSDSIGGLIGFGGGVSVENCYSIGAVSGAFSPGGLVSQAVNGSYVASYWNIQTSGLANSAGGAGRTTAQMTTLPYEAGTYESWDFTTVWAEDTYGDNGGYPFLRWQGVSLDYTAGANGSLDGSPLSQFRLPGFDGPTVTAVPSTGYNFIQWSDGVTDNPRTDLNVTKSIIVTAQFTQKPNYARIEQADGTFIQVESPTGTVIEKVDLLTPTLTIPPNTTFPEGLLDIQISGGPVGGTIPVTITYENRLSGDPCTDFFVPNGGTYVPISPAANVNDNGTTVTVTLQLAD